MSTIDRDPVGGFEQRLLSQLKAQVVTAPEFQPRPAAPGHRLRLPRTGSLLTAAVAGVAMLVAALNLLPGSQMALAQAFPILTQRSQRLPAALQQLLRSQRLPQSSGASDRERAYAFQAPTGTGYVVIDQQEKWICLLVPGLRAGHGHVLCETSFRLLNNGRRELQLSASHHGTEDIVQLLPKGAKATLISTQGAGAVALHNGVLTVVTRRPVSITTTIGGHETTTRYGTASTTDRER